MPKPEGDYSVYEVNYGQVACEAYRRANGQPFSAEVWQGLSSAEREGFIEAAIAVLDTFTKAALV